MTGLSSKPQETKALGSCSGLREVSSRLQGKVVLWDLRGIPLLGVALKDHILFLTCAFMEIEDIVRVTRVV